MYQHRSIRRVASVLSVLVTGLIVFYLFSGNHHDELRSDLSWMEDQLNGRDYAWIEDWVEPELGARLTRRLGDLEQLWAQLKHIDRSEGRIYRFTEVRFPEENVAEADWERSGINGTFEGKTIEVIVPFVYRENRWWIADGDWSDQ